MFRPIVRIRLPGRETSVSSAQTARDALTHSWPARRGPRYREALDICVKAIAGERSAAEARTAFRKAAEEAGVLQEIGRPWLARRFAS